MTAMVAERWLDLDDVIAEGVRRCDSGESVAQVASSLAQRSLQPDTAQHLLGLGIERVLHHALEAQRNQLGRPDEVSNESDWQSVRPPAALHPHAAKMLRMYATADGVRRALDSFTLADWRALRTQAAGQAEGWGKLAAAADIAITALERTGKATTADLSKAARQAIVEALP